VNRFLLTSVGLAMIGALLAVHLAANDVSPLSTPQVDSRCIRADDIPFEADVKIYPDRDDDDQILAELADGEDFDLTNGYIVLSRDTYDPDADIWFVAAEMVGDDIAPGTVGVWATTRIDADGSYTGNGLINSINDNALEHTLWGPGAKTPWKLTMDRDGAKIAVSCVERSLES